MSIKTHYQLKRSQKRRTIEVKVTEESDIIVMAPKWVSQSEINQFVESKSKWIQQVKQRQAELRQPPYQFEPFDELLYLNQVYRLNISEGETTDVYLKDRVIWLPRTVYERGHSARKEALIRWYKDRAKEIILDRVRLISDQMGVTPNQVRIKTVQT